MNEDCSNQQEKSTESSLDQGIQHACPLWSSCTEELTGLAAHASCNGAGSTHSAPMSRLIAPDPLSHILVGVFHSLMLRRAGASGRPAWWLGRLSVQPRCTTRPGDLAAAC